MGTTTNTAQGKLDKLKLNNQIVLMRKDVRRARLWLINNLSSRARKLLAKKGNEQQLTKNKRKAERLKVEIETLKHIDIDDVTKYALSSKQDPEEAQKMLEQLPVEQRSMLRLASHKLVQAQVVKFRQTFPISRGKLILMIRALGAKYQKKKAKEPVAEVKTRKKTPSDRPLDGPPKTGNNDAKPVKEKEKTSNVEETKKDSSSGDESRSSSPCSLETPDESLQPTPVEEKKEADDETVEVKKKSVAKVKVEWPTLPKQTFEKREGTMEIKRIDLNQPDLVIPTEADSVNESKLDTDSLSKPLDSFFLGGHSSDEDEEDKSNETTGRWNRKQLGVNRRHHGFADVQPIHKRQATKPQGNRESKPSKNLWKPSESTESKGSQLDEKNLHPSWQAKRKQKEHLNPVTAFQGKKIKFDDD